MKLLATLALTTSAAYATSCPVYTAEQERLLDMACAVGEPADLCYTLASIIEQESFVEDRVIRAFPHDGAYGSYGVGHMTLTTARELLGVTSYWETMDDIFMALVTDDVEAIKLSLLHLTTYTKPTLFATIRRYNGGGSEATAYANKIMAKIKLFQACGRFNYG